MTRGAAVVPVALALLLLGLLDPAAGDPVEHGHASSRWSASRPSLRAQLDRFDRRGAQLVTWTEVRERASTLRRAPHWRTYAPTRHTDAAVSWRRGDDWRLVHRAAWLLTAVTFGFGRTYAAAVVLDRRDLRVLVTSAHLPSHVEYGDSWRPGVPVRVEAWRQAVGTWSRKIARAARRWGVDLVVAAADWNVNLRRPSWRRRVLDEFPGLRATWSRPYPRRGTHAAGRLIDGTLTNARGRARLLPRTTASDHRPYLERLAP